MGLILEISLDKSIREIDAFFNDLKFRAVVLAARQALNRSAKSIRSNAIKRIRKHRNLKLQDLKGSKKKGKKGFVTIQRARGTELAKLEARVNFSSMPLPLILFLVGQNTPKSFKNIPNVKRASRNIKIRKGQAEKRPGLFVQKAQHGSRRYQLFRRADPSNVSAGFKLQTAPSIAELLRSKSGLLRRIENTGIKIMEREFDAALKFQLSKLKL